MGKFHCICRESFDTKEEINDHWKDNNIETTGRPHYLLISEGSSALEHDSDYPFPGIHRDGPP